MLIKAFKRLEGWRINFLPVFILQVVIPILAMLLAVIAIQHLPRMWLEIAVELLIAKYLIFG
jgi:hypothetical protein